MTILRVGDIIQTYDGCDHEQLTGPSVDGHPWPCLILPLDFQSDEGPFLHHVPADFAERAAEQGRIRYPVDPWSTWTDS